VLPVVLAETEVARLFDDVAAFPGFRLTVDLERQVVRRPDGRELAFEVEPHRRECLLGGLDDIGLTLRHADAIRTFEAGRHAARPWLA
jgi:3-isopropylmalate/(R)-2-methylmalate dehydratase small subunit